MNDNNVRQNLNHPNVLHWAYIIMSNRSRQLCICIYFVPYLADYSVFHLIVMKTENQLTNSQFISFFKKTIDKYISTYKCLLFPLPNKEHQMILAWSRFSYATATYVY